MTFILLIVFTLGISFWASSQVNGKYRKYSQLGVSSGATGAQAAAEILRRENIQDVEVVAKPGKLIDHYDPMNKRLVLSEQNYYGKSVAAVGIAAHEVGHAIQHARSYSLLNLRMAVAGTTNIANQMVMWLPIIGMFTGIFATGTGFMIMAVGWGIIMFFNLITLPVEFDASARAKKCLGDLAIVRGGQESTGVAKMLDAAALTYVAAFLTSLAYLLYYLLPLIGGSDD